MNGMVVKLIVLSCFIGVFAFSFRNGRYYVVPFVLLIYSNINGLLDWEDFALKGVIKFQDYGLLITLCLLVSYAFGNNRKEPKYMLVARNTMLYNAMNAFWIFYAGVFAFSVIIQGPLWAIKMGRVFFFGLVIYVLLREVMDDPLVRFEKLIRVLMWATLFFGGLYILYNLTNLPIYPRGEHEIFNISYLDNEVKRNFSGFPTFAHFFIFYFTDRLLRGEGNAIFNLLSLIALMLCVVMMLTRGTLILTIAMTLFMVIYRRLDAKALVRLAISAILLAILVPVVLAFTENYYMAMVRRFDEFAVKGVLASSNSMVRIKEFERIFANIMDFNPFFGFGFTNVWGLGYVSNVYHGGSADNGYSNLLGTTGFIGIGFFFVLMFSWLAVNLKLQALKAEHISRVNFVFIVFVFAAMMNNAHAGYVHFFGIFMIYDLLAYAYFKHQLGLASQKSTLSLGTI